MRKKFFIILAACLMLYGLVSLPTSSAVDYGPFDVHGPLIDKVIYRSVGDPFAALASGDVDFIDEILHDDLAAANSDPDIETIKNFQDGYDELLINCDKYPLNYSAFRRAFALALDKNGMDFVGWGDLAQPHDSVVPPGSPWCIEDDLPYRFYTAQIELANETLEAAGFLDVDEDGFREAPDGSDFDVVVEYYALSPGSAAAGQYAGEALNAIGIDAQAQSADVYDVWGRVHIHGDYDIAWYNSPNIGSIELDFLYTNFHSDWYGIDYCNPTNYRNDTVDYWIEEMQTRPTYEGVVEATIKLQEILAYESPTVICHNRYRYSAYRSDRVVGFASDTSIELALQNVNRVAMMSPSAGGPVGGTFYRHYEGPFSTNNIMSATYHAEEDILGNLYDSLLMLDENGNDIPNLGLSYEVDTHDTNSTVPIGQSRVVFDIFRNSTWSDGEPFTARDVVFTMSFYTEGAGNPLAAGLENLMGSVQDGDYRVIFGFSTESYWNIFHIAHKPILPYHILEGLGQDNWDTWNPTPGELVTCSPFYIADNDVFEQTVRAGHVRPNSQTGPFIDSPSDITYVEGNTGNDIVWHPRDLDPDTYDVTRNGSSVDSGTWTGTLITVDVDGLAAGTYEYTLTVVDQDGYSNSDSVIVIVDASTTPPPVGDDRLVFIAGIGVVVVVVVGIVVFKRGR